MDRTSLPVTEAMLATSVDIFVVVPISVSNLGFELTVPLTAAIGTIDKFERSNSREITRRYSLGKHAFEPLDLIPGPITTSINVSKIVLYKDKYAFPLSKQIEAAGLGQAKIDQITQALEINGEFQGLFGMSGGNVLYQQKPVHIQVINYDNSGVEGWDTSGRKVASITYYWNCWFEDNPISYNLQNAGDILVRQDVKLSVGRVEVFEPNLSRVLTNTAASIIPTSISL